MSRIDAAIAAKIDKRTELEKAGVNPHPYYFAKSHTIAQCRDSLETKVKTAGRVISFRPHGKVIFVDLSDQSGRIQVMFRQSEIGEQVFDQIKKLLDPGDFLGVEGLVTTTKTGEVTIIADKYEFLGKAIRPLPSSWNAAEDKEIRFRKRYLDMLVNPDVKKILDARWLIEKEIRRFLQDQFDFTEVETPILQPLYGGTNAKPFTTHMNALDSDLYLRIAPELYLKRLIVGGYDRIFEIARNFRNEGMDQTHNPEFTMIEWYQTYADYHQMMDTAESLIRHLVQVVKGNTILQIHNTEVDVKDPWPRLKMTDAVNEHLKLDFESTSDDELKKLIAQNNLEMPVNFTRGLALFVLFDKLVAPRLINPTWIIDYPRDVSPLAKQHRVLAGFAERFEAYIGGKELADGWSEIVDPIDQRSIFENEQKRMRSGDSEAHPMDEEFLEAMEYGMPPLGGIGMGIDRLVMFLTNTWSIREVVAFPTQKQLPSQMASHQATTQIESKKEAAAPQETTQITTLPSREAAQQLLEEHIKNKALRWHCEMVAMAMEAYAQELGEDSELWYQAGLLHDLDWESHPDEHPNHAVKNILSAYPEVLKHAILAHAPDRTGVQPSSTLERYLFACDEISGFFNAVSLLRPEGFAGMKVSSITKKLKDKSFAVNVSRDDIAQGCELINKDIAQHIQFLIGVFGNLPKQN